MGWFVVNGGRGCLRFPHIASHAAEWSRVEQPHRVLVVDDEPDVRLVLSTILELESFSVQCAADGSEAIGAAHAFAPDVVLMDIMMPGIGGLEATREIKRRNPDMPVVLLSAKASRADQELGRTAGAIDFITKPFDPSELIERLKAAIGTAEVDA